MISICKLVVNFFVESKIHIQTFIYFHEEPDLILVLKNMGIKNAFNSEKADFTNIMKKNSDNLYISDTVHKTHIDLNESGTKAAAVTYFGFAKSALNRLKKSVNIKFNKPFIYMIRDSKTGEMLLFGAVYEPNIWKKSTCEN